MKTAENAKGYATFHYSVPNFPLSPALALIFTFACAGDGSFCCAQCSTSGPWFYTEKTGPRPPYLIDPYGHETSLLLFESLSEDILTKGLSKHVLMTKETILKCPSGFEGSAG